MKAILLVLAASLAGCSGVTSTLRYGADGNPEYFIDCSGASMTRCYEKALELCPGGYFLTKESETPAGTKGGEVFGRTKHVGGSSHDTQITFKNEIAIRCKAATQTPARPPTQTSN